jgi:hypothetical protein
VRVDEYGTARTADFPANSAGEVMFSAVRSEIDIIEAKASAQSSGLNMEREGTATRAIARETLRSQLDAISRTAGALALAGTTPGLENRFRMPRGNNDQSLLNAARAFRQDATPIAASFVNLGLSPNFLINLDTAIEEFEQAINRQNTGRDTHVTATTAIDEALERGINLVRQLDAIVRNKYSDDPPQLAAWQSASHIERSPQRAKQTEPPDAPTP